MRESSCRTATYLTGVVSALTLCGVAWLNWQWADLALADDLPAPEAIVPSQSATPSRVEGHEKCLDCHQLEVQAWLASKHATRAFDLLRTAPTAREYAENLGIRPTDIARKSLCVTCHATPRQGHAGNATVIAGVSCEACHNAAGGEDGWLNLHAVYGPRGARRTDESARHRAARVAKCEQAGQLRSANAYQLIKRCFACHVVGDEALAEAGHEHGDRFEVVEKMMGEVRHNFFLDARENALTATLWTDALQHGPGRTATGRLRVLFVVGQLVDAETSLRSLARATDENDFSDLMVERIEDAFGLLAEDLLEELETTRLPEIERFVEVVEPVIEKLDDDGFDPADHQLYLQAAEQVANIAKAFAKRDGSALTEIDGLDLIPPGPFDAIYQPAGVAQPADQR